MATATFNKQTEKAVLVNYNEPVVAIEEKGLNILTTGVFVVGVIAGSGFLTIPRAVEDTGWIGFVLLIGGGAVAVYTGHLIGECWTLVLAKYPQYKQGQVRNPYPAIGGIAYGQIGRYLVSFCINISMFGSAIVYLLISGENIAALLPDNSLNFCYITLIVGAVLTPLTWLGTPKDFWGLAAAATIATGSASLIAFGAFVHSDGVNPVKHVKVDVISFFTGWGTIVTGLNGHATFSSFQADMKEPKKFRYALIIGYIVVALMYVPTTAISYVRYGDQLDDNILQTLPSGAANIAVSILMTTHLVAGVVIVLNPVTQELEHVLAIPDHFTWKRIVSRTGMMAAALFLAESVPKFSSILALIGGSSISALCFVFPPLFYIRLCKINGIPVSLHKHVFLCEIVLMGILAGAVATYSAIQDLAVSKFTVPCYVDPIRAGGS